MRSGLLDPHGDAADAAGVREMPPELADDVVHDLHVDRLLEAMSAGDRIIRGAAREVLLHPVSDPDVIEHRQRALSDCLRHRDRIEELHTLAEDALTVPRDILFSPMRGHPSSELSAAVRRLNLLADHLERLNSLCPVLEQEFASSAFRDLGARLSRELTPTALRELRELLHELELPDGLLISAGVGPTGAVDPILVRRIVPARVRMLTRMPLGRPRSTFVLPERDQAGGEALASLRDEGLVEVAHLAAHAVEEITGFFADLRRDLAFYRGCMRLADALRALGAPLCLPDPRSERTTTARDLYDPCLALRQGSPPVPVDIALGDSTLLVITGANEGGKTTLLRALGLAQLMMQAGMMVAAEQFSGRPAGRVLTHWEREEDPRLTHGKLDEELGRMRRIVDAIRPGDLLLCNESFSSTDEAEGSELLLEVTRALLAGGVQVRTVTHLHDFARALLPPTTSGDGSRPVHLRAARGDAAGRSFRFEAGPPLTTSFGLDMYDRLFGTHLADAPTAR